MANTLANFLVGIGLDFDNKGAKEAATSMDGIKRSALQAAAAVGGAFSAKAVTFGLAEQTRGYSLLAEQIGSTASNVFALDRAYQRAGGGAGQILGQLERLKELQAGLQVGDVGFIESAAKAGIDVGGIINIEDPTKIFENIVAQLEGMSTNQRINAINALGLDPTTISIAEDGIAGLQEQLSKALGRRDISDRLKKDSEELATSWFDLKDNIGGAADEVGSKLIPAINDLLGFSNELFDLWNEGFSIGEIAGETSKGGRLSAQSTIGDSAAWLDTPVSELLADAAFYTDKAINDAISSLPGIDSLRPGDPYEGTVITPQDTAPLSAPVQYMMGQNNAMEIQKQQIPNYGREQTKTMQPITIQLDGRQMKTFVVETMEKQDEQALRDLRSPIDR